VNLLALDTSTEYCSVAVWRDGLVCEREVHAGQRHSELLLGMVDEVLRESGMALAALDAIAYGKGPGTFTGLRIGCGVTQGLAYAAGLPVCGVSTLEAIALGCGGVRAVCCIDARMHEVYHGAYERSASGWVAVHEPSVCAPAAAPMITGERWIACGSGFAAYRDALLARYAGKLERVAPDAFPRARHIAELAAPVLARGGGLSAESAAPVYIRDKVALKTDERAA
jgi:tRNA threonylcarbamoyladenosine biosynthesis protein TsaB